MNVINSVKDYVTNVFDFQQATASGAIDIVAVQHEDGTFWCSPFHVHFGKVELKKKTDKTVTLCVNGKVVDGVHMKLGAAGEAFFVDATAAPVEDEYSTSPLASPSGAIAIPPSKTTQSPSIDTAEAIRSHSPEHAEWHDAYRLVPEARPALLQEVSAPADRLTWGWGALPIVRARSVADLSALTEESQHDEEQPKMVKNDSVYFDAVEPEASLVTPYVTDHPCMSLCGQLLETGRTREEAHAIFSEHIVSSEAFLENAAELLINPDLRFLINGKIYPFNSEVQAFLVSRVLFPSSQPAPLTCSWTVATRHQRRASERLESGFWFGDFDDDEEDADGPQQINEANDAEPPKRRWFHWFPRSSSTGDAPSETPSFQPVEHPLLKSGRSAAALSTLFEFFRKTLEPSQEQLKKMDLRHGTNEIEFIVHNASGVDRVSAKLFLWPMSAKIIIAEIDGAISRAPSSRRLSTLLPIMEKDATGPHQGALDFYNRAARNGYRIVYLTSRGLSQADLIHEMLRGPSSPGKNRQSLPNGPVLLSPDRLLDANPDDLTVTRDFKFAALKGIRALFPDDVNPFYAAFGKTYADSVVFTEAGVFPGKVFLVDEGDGRLRHRSMMNYQESYSSLFNMVDKMFPPICSPSPRHPLRRHSRSATTSSPMDLPMSWPGTSSLSSPSSLSPMNMKRVSTATEELVSEVISSHVRTRSMGDEAYNDVNFWRIKPGSIS